MPLTPGQLLHQRYQIHSLLGQGGMGSVYRATDTVMQRVVAIKERTPDSNATPQGLAQARAQFEREARILGALAHPNLPHVYDFFNVNGNEYVVMEFIEGQNLLEAVQQHGAINEGAVRAWAEQILDALIYLHERNIIHRDIKPANIILKSDGKVALVDFGLVKLFDPTDPRTMTAMRGLGTAEYAPLEQFSPGMHTDARSDIYSLGATLYHLLTGRAPLDVPRRLLNPNQQPTIRALNLKISTTMETAVEKAMEVQPQGRWQSAREMRLQWNLSSIMSHAPAYLPQPLQPSQHPQPAYAPPPTKSASRLPWAWVLVLGTLAMIGLFIVPSIFRRATPTPPPPLQTSGPATFVSPTDVPVQPTAARLQPTAVTEPTKLPSVQPTALPIQITPLPILNSLSDCAPGAARVVWFVGLGAGTQPDDVKKETAWADKYNKSQTDVGVVLNVVYNQGWDSYDALRAQIAAGKAPDIVGPNGKAGRASFKGAWADIEPLAKVAGYDLSKYDPKLLDFAKDEGVLVGIPFALFPSFLYYNKALFDEARLPYPPHKVGEKYDGKDWNLETFTELAKKLTIDANGNNATSIDFDPKTVKQFGFFEQWTDARGVGTFFGGGLPFNPSDPKTAVIPEHWKAAWKWYYDGVWNKHFMPNADYANSANFGQGNVFASGNLAMSWVHTWYTCCFDLAKMNWDIAVMPEIKGKTTAKLHGDTFAILKDSKNKEAAFKVLSAMVVDKDLYQIYGGMPAREEDRPEFFARLGERTAPNKVDWAVAEEMLLYPDLPNHEAWLPNITKANDLFNKFRTYMDQTPGVDMDAAIADLQAELEAVFKAASSQ